MTYQKINFLDQEVERPRTYEMQQNTDGTVTLVDSFGIITEIGTPINRDNMNHIEEGILTLDNSIESRIIDVLKLVYPVGAEYMGTMDICPLSALFGTWEKLPGDRVLQTSGTMGNPNTLITQGAPGIYGGAMMCAWNYIGADGALGGTSYGATWFQGGYSSGPVVYANSRIDFNASRSNSTYSQPQGRVQPYAIVVNVWRRVA